MIRPVLRIASVAAILAAVAATAVPASAQTVEETYVRYHAAIFAADECTDYDLIQLGTDDADAEWKSQAQNNMGAYIAENGCDGPMAQELLGIFNRELEPLLPPR